MLTFQIARPRLQSALTVNLKYTKNKSGLWDFLVLKKLRLQDNLVKIEIVRCNWLLKKKQDCNTSELYKYFGRQYQ